MDKNVYKVDFVTSGNSPYGSDYPNLDWIKAGIKILRDQGPHQISITNLCGILEKSDADFNKHFSSIEEFFTALLDYWYEKETLSYIEMMDEVGGTAEENLFAMAQIIHNVDKTDEVAIRNLALLCPDTCNALAKVDRTRIDFAIGLFKEMGFSDKQSSQRAKILYTSSIGTEYTAISSSLEQRYAMCEILTRRD